MKKIFKILEEVGNAFFVRYAEPVYEEVRKKGRENKWEDWKTSLFYFVGYTFERQGRPPDWAQIAKDVIEENIKINGIKELNEKLFGTNFVINGRILEEKVSMHV